MSATDVGASPLVEIERHVQERAKARSLDLAAPGGLDHLRALIGDEVAAWSEQHRQGLLESRGVV